MNIFVPGYLGIMVTRQQQFCCIFAATKDKFGSFLKKLFLFSTLHTYHHNSNWTIRQAMNYRHIIWMVPKQYGEINGYLYEIMALFLEPATMASNLQLGPSGPMKAAVSLMEKTKIALLLT